MIDTTFIFQPKSTGQRLDDALAENAELHARVVELEKRVAWVPEGWKLVPVVLTDEMWSAGRAEGTTDKAWEAMLQAAPNPPVDKP